ncbi:MAG: RlmE family RNA methyltransferase [Thermoprotei archaeon]|jgi:23S rRNA (uridine2552-2'-O)-methyltransferase
MKKERKDGYYWMAKREGFRSRAAYKLLQINRRFHVMKPGDKVIDLGAAPGGWTQVARLIVGESGFILSIDINDFEPLPYENVKILNLDITDENASEQILKRLKDKADVVLCDAAPKVSGIWDLDHQRQLRLVEAALRIAYNVLKSNGNFVTKIFEGAESKQIVNKAKELFKQVYLHRPPATRSSSSEIYLICKGFLGKIKEKQV